MIAVTTFLWRDPTRDSRGYTFHHDHVRILKNMVERNLSLPHKFLCITDDEIEGVETRPLDWSKHLTNTVYLRLMQHRPDILDVYGHEFTKIMSIDIDVVITGNFNHVAGRREDAVFWRNPNFGQPRRSFYQSSVQVFTPGARSCLYDDFNPKETIKHVNWRFGAAEQAWISERLPWNEAYFSDKDGIYGAGRLGGKGIYTELPENACIVSFPGARAPWQKEVQEKHKWIAEHYR